MAFSLPLPSSLLKLPNMSNTNPIFTVFFPRTSGSHSLKMMNWKNAPTIFLVRWKISSLSQGVFFMKKVAIRLCSRTKRVWIDIRAVKVRRYRPTVRKTNTNQPQANKVKLSTVQHSKTDVSSFSPSSE